MYYSVVASSIYHCRVIFALLRFASEQFITFFFFFRGFASKSLLHFVFRSYYTLRFKLLNYILFWENVDISAFTVVYYLRAFLKIFQLAAISVC